MPPKSDPQRDNLYWLEAEFNGWWRMVKSTKRDLDELARCVCKYYGVDQPKVVFSRKESDCDGDYWEGIITLYVKNRGNNPGVLLHELAHHIIDEVYEHVEHHGPEFMAIYMHLLDRWGFLSNEEFRRLAKKFKLKIARRYRPIAFKK